MCHIIQLPRLRGSIFRLISCCYSIWRDGYIVRIKSWDQIPSYIAKGDHSIYKSDNIILTIYLGQGIENIYISVNLPSYIPFTKEITRNSLLKDRQIDS